MTTTTQPSLPPEPASAERSHSVALYLLALVLVILVPALIVSLVLLQRNNQAQDEIVRSLTNATVQAMAQSADREISGMITTLRVLSTDEAFAAGDFAGFHDRGALALTGSGAYLLVLDRQFQQVLNTRLPFGTPLGKTSDPDSAADALESGAPTISNLFFGRTAQQWVFNVLLPLPDAPEPAALLVLTQNGANLNGALQSRQLPDGWHAALVDKANVVIASTPDAGVIPGVVLSMRQAVGETSPSDWRRETIDGRPIVTAEARSILTGWRVVAWSAAASVDRALGESILWLAAWGTVIAAGAGIVAFIIAGRIGRSVRGLRRDAALLGRGEAVEAKHYPVSEIAEVSLALAEASQLRQAAERDVRFLMRELAHRSKNQMTVIAAMAKQTARGAEDVASYVQGFERRIMGLAGSTDLLLTHGRAGVALTELIEHQIAPFSPLGADRVEIGGPLVRLNAQAAQILGMALHELSTNAAKYGAFSDETGTLEVHWTRPAGRLDLVWREKLRRRLVAGDRKGFGTTVLQAMVGGSLGADVERVAHDDGIEWRFSIPLAAIDPALTPVPPAALTATPPGGN